MACTKIKHVKCLIFGGRRGHVPRRAELKKGREALFQQPVKEAPNKSILDFSAPDPKTLWERSFAAR
jgi:hypothetical protein